MKIKTLETLNVKDKIISNKNKISEFKLKTDDIINNFNENVRSSGITELKNNLEKLKDNLNDLYDSISKSITLAIITTNAYSEKNFSDIEKFHISQNIRHLKNNEDNIRRIIKKVIEYESYTLRLHKKLEHINLNKDNMSLIKENLNSVNENLGQIATKIK